MDEPTRCCLPPVVVRASSALAGTGRPRYSATTTLPRPRKVARSLDWDISYGDSGLGGSDR